MSELELNQIYHMDCLEGMKQIPDKSIHLVCIDPPYNIKKAKWDSWKTVKEYVEWMGQVFLECERVLKDNGSFYFFHNDFLQIVELQNWLNQHTEFVFKQLIIWDKYNGTEWNQLKAIVHSEENRNYSKQAEYCLFYTFQDETGLLKVKHDTANFEPLRSYFKRLQEEMNLGLKKINEKLGHRKAEHSFYWKSTQWDMPTPETYQELIDVFHIDSFSFFKEYEELRKEYEELRKEYEELRKEYEELRYTYNNQKLPSVQQYPVQKQNGHITPKPIELIENIIRTSSNEGDIVLDCFMGSGTTAIAAINTNRTYIGFEQDNTYYDLANERIEEHLKGTEKDERHD